MRLSDVKEGREVRILSLEGGKGLRVRLTRMGIHPGDRVIVERNSFGPILIELHGNSIALGRGIAAKVEVEPL